MARVHRIPAGSSVPARYPRSGYSEALTRLPVGTPGVSVRLDQQDVVRLTRDLRGRFVGGAAQRALARAHEQMSVVVRQYAVEELEKARSRRPPRTTSLLAEAIRDDQNRLVTAQGFLVGRPPWLIRSPAALYWRRIEEGGPNPMAAMGSVVGHFFDPGGPHVPDPGQRGKHGRLLEWRRVRHGGFRVLAEDRAFRGYHMHRKAGERFEASGLAASFYRDAFRAQGLDLMTLYQKQHGG